MHYLRSAHNLGLFAALCACMLWHLSYFEERRKKNCSFINLRKFPTMHCCIDWLHWAAYFIWVLSDQEIAFICENIFWQSNRIFYYCYVWKLTYSDKENETVQMIMIFSTILSKRRNTSVIWYLTIFKQGKHACHLRLDSF